MAFKIVGQEANLGQTLVKRSIMYELYPSLPARFKNSKAYVMGYNAYGQLGLGHTDNVSVPTELPPGSSAWKILKVGELHSAGIKEDGTLWMWGNNATGQLGDGTVISKSAPTQTVAGGNNWKYISLSAINSSLGAYSAGIKTDGTLWMWGSNNFGQLGNLSNVNRSSPVQTSTAGTNWSSVYTARTLDNAWYQEDAPHTIGIKTDGTMWSWGHNLTGQLGLNHNVTKSSPTQVMTGGSWKTAHVTTNHTAAIKTDGTLWMWGANSYDRLGTGGGPYSSPVQIAAGGNNWKSIMSSSEYRSYGTVAIKTDGTMWMWGGAYSNSNLEIFSIGATALDPYKVPGNDWKYAEIAEGTGMAIKNDGTLWVWGANDYGQMGQGHTTAVPTPTKVSTGGSTWSNASQQAFHTVGIVESNPDL